MLAVVALLGGSFSLLIWNAYRVARTRAVEGAEAPDGATAASGASERPGQTRPGA